MNNQENKMRIAVSRTNASITMKVVEHIIVKNFWEYYILDDSEHNPNWDIKDNIQFAYVLGFENEYGSVSREEIIPYIMTKTRELDELLPPEGYDWDDEDSYEDFSQRRTNERDGVIT